MCVLHRHFMVFLLVLLVLAMFSCRSIRVHSPTEETFYVPNVDEPLPVLISFSGMNAMSPVHQIELIDSDGRTVFQRGGPPTTGPMVTIMPGGIEGQFHTLNLPVRTSPGWYTVKVSGERVVGTSESFRLSRIGRSNDDHALSVFFPVETAFHPGESIHLWWHAWGSYCVPEQGFSVTLFHNGSHGASHSHWILADNVVNSEGVFLLPVDVPASGIHFVRVYNNPRCEGTSNIIPIRP